MRGILAMARQDDEWNIRPRRLRSQPPRQPSQVAAEQRLFRHEHSSGTMRQRFDQGGEVAADMRHQLCLGEQFARGVGVPPDRGKDQDTLAVLVTHRRERAVPPAAARCRQRKKVFRRTLP